MTTTTTTPDTPTPAPETGASTPDSKSSNARMNKRQKRAEYASAVAKAQAQKLHSQRSTRSESIAAGSPAPASSVGGDDDAAADSTVVAQGGESENVRLEMPQKRFFRQRAHANPFSDHQLDYPVTPADMDWAAHYPDFVDYAEEMDTSGEGGELGTTTRKKKLIQDVEVADIGCGFGGLIVSLAPVFPETLMLGMEIRAQVTSYVHNRILALRSQNPTHPPPAYTDSALLSSLPVTPATPTHAPYTNISVLRSNTMKFLPNYFRQSQLKAIFLCFPDPHFKARKHKARIVSNMLNAEYAYVVRPGGKIYTITDVQELHEWMARHFDGGEDGDLESGVVPDSKLLWERVAEEEVEADPCVKIMKEETEEGKKVTRNGGNKFVGVWRRRENPPWE